MLLLVWRICFTCYYIWFRFFRRRRVCLVVDGVRHAYGSVVHDTLRWLLRLAGFPDAVVELLLLATTEATVHMVGSSGVTKALARLLAGVAQGCPVSAMVFCVVAEVHAFLALLRPHVGALVDRSTGWDTWMTPHGASIQSPTFL